MVEHHRPPATDHIAGHVGLGRRDPPHQVMEQRHVQGLRQLRASHGAGHAGSQARVNVHLFMDFPDRFGGQATFEQRLEMGHRQ
jgi:hypothetical protein